MNSTYSQLVAQLPLSAIQRMTHTHLHYLKVLTIKKLLCNITFNKTLFFSSVTHNAMSQLKWPVTWRVLRNSYGLTSSAYLSSLFVKWQSFLRETEGISQTHNIKHLTCHNIIQQKSGYNFTEMKNFTHPLYFCDLKYLPQRVYLSYNLYMIPCQIECYTRKTALRSGHVKAQVWSQGPEFKSWCSCSHSITHQNSPNLIYKCPQWEQ